MANLYASLLSLQEQRDNNLSVEVLESTKVTVDSVIETCYAWTCESNWSKYREGRKYADHFQQLETDLRARVDELALAKITSNRGALESSIRRKQNSICARLQGGEEMIYAFDPPDSVNGERASLLGRGAFGRAHRVKERGGLGPRRAMKIVDIDRALDVGVKLETLYNEAKLLASLEHPNIAGYITSFEYGLEFFVVMEYVGGGHLGVQIGKSHDVKTLRRCALQIFGALDYIHAQGVLHRDLKPENVLLVVEGDYSSVKLADFGLATQMVTAGLRSGVATLNYMSPQIAANNQRYDAAAAADDMWGSGCVLGELLAGTRLGDRCPRTAFCNDLQAVEDVCTQSRKADGVLGAIVCDLLKTVPAQRPSAAEAAARLVAGGGGASSERSPPEEPNRGGGGEAAAERMRREQQEQKQEREEAETKAEVKKRRRGAKVAHEQREEKEREEEAERKALPSHGASERVIVKCCTDWRWILEPLETDDRDLAELDLCSGCIGDPDAVRLAAAIEKNTSLQKLNLAGDHVGAESAARLAASLEKNRSLRTLDLTGNRIGARGAARLAKSLEKNASLETLNLAYNHIYAEGAARLAKSLEKNTTLQKLNLAFNDIRDQGAARVAESLEKNRSLQELNLAGNCIYAEGAGHLAECLEKNTSLRTLDLMINEIDAEGAARLAASLEKNRSLQELKLGGNYIYVEGAGHFAECLEKNTSLRTLDLTCNRIGAENTARLVECLEKNPSGMTFGLTCVFPVGVFARI
ncbi:hypothetical protein CTAYLR_003824 [Chrysophaeum taylorii]|uniref:Protein kinase domain-containing protein n=1 Tax=Chrysophaeum taylorii TaxID=2483200 RepID=A0AAD7UEF1_9STRA|nr:hypothetical protein CTAYLR_003824 [Chrysophaeum taylorii]